MAKRQGTLSTFGFSVGEPTEKIIRQEETVEAKEDKKGERKFFKKWCSEFSWVAVRDSKMFCKICETTSSRW